METKKVFVVGLLSLLFVLIIPRNTNAQYVDVSNAIKEYPADFFAYEAANWAIKRIANQTVNWINSGFQGQPAYVTDPKAFFLDVGDRIASDFLSGPEMNKICTPFNAKIRLALVKNYISEDNETYSCSLGILKNNYDNFINDFDQGGWGAWFEITQNPSNNPYGAYIEAQSSLNKQLGIEQNKLTKELETGRGFLSYKKCKPSSILSQSDINSLGAAGAKYKVGDCWNNDVEVVTPGSVIQGQLDKVLSSGENRIEAADEVDEIVGALLNQLISRVVGGIGNGLLGASRSTPTQKSISDQLASEPTRTSSNPNAGSVSGGQPVCTTTGGTPGVYDANGNLIEAPEPGVTNCTSSPVVFNSPTNTNPNDPAYCQNVTDTAVLAIITKYTPSDAGLQQALIELRNVFGFQVFAFGNPGERDKLDFGGGLTADVVFDISGTNPSWQWLELTPCGGSTGGGGGGASAPTDALTKHPDQTAVVAQAKANLQTQGVNLSGACGAWAIVNEAAKLIGGGAGLLDKPSGNMCNGYATDIIAFPDGYIFDALIDGGNLNTPTWNPSGCGTNGTCASRYRPAV